MVAGEADLAGLEAERARLYAELGGVGDFRRGTLSAVFRRCGKPNCRCARPGDRGHGPQWNWVRWAGGKTVTTHPRPGPDLDKAQREAAQWERFKSLTGRIEAVNEAICDARPLVAEPGATAFGPGEQKGGGSARSSLRRSRRRPQPR
ncbi:MAG: hypothetical protein J2P32_14365 [Actinobacteria bacterium]|nr:hypothetical protein [Actinomycetota bacterium]